MEKVEIKSKGAMVEIKATMTAGKVHAIINALQKHAEVSATAYDVRSMFRNACQRDAANNPDSYLKDVQ